MAIAARIDGICHHTFKRTLSILKKAKKIKLEGKDWQLIKVAPSGIDLIQKLEVLEAPQKRKRGRPKKNV